MIKTSFENHSKWYRYRPQTLEVLNRLHNFCVGKSVDRKSTEISRKLNQNFDTLKISRIHWIDQIFEIKNAHRKKFFRFLISEFNLTISMKLKLTVNAISFTPETFPQTSRIVVAAKKTFNHCNFTAFNADIA